MKLFGKEAAKAILQECLNIREKSKYDEIVDVKDDGVWTTPFYRSLVGKAAASERDRILWTYWCELDRYDPLELPNLPIPFSASELAAFMLDGVGLSVQLAFGDFEDSDSPSVDALEAMPGYAREPKQALREAYKAFREAKERVRKLDGTLETEAAALAEEYRRKNSEANAREGVFATDIPEAERQERRRRAKESVSELKELSLHASKRSECARLAWRKAMVIQLLDVDHMSNDGMDSQMGTLQKLGSSSFATRDVSSLEAPGYEAAEHGVIKGTPTTKNRLVHKIGNRGGAILSAEIAQAREVSQDAHSAQSIWDALTKLAEKRVGPMIGFASDGIQYRGKKFQATGEPDIFTFKNLRERLAREKVRRDA